MSSKFLNIILTLVCIAMCILLMNRKCTNKPCQNLPADTIFHVDTMFGDTVPVVSIHEVPVIRYADTGSVEYRFHDVDTALILRSYFSKNYYCDTLKNDTSAMVVIIDVVSENKLGQRKMIFKNNRPVAINTTITPVTAISSWYIGAVSTFSDSISYFGPVITYCKPSYSISVSANILNTGGVSVSYSRKFSLKKQK